MLFTVKLVPSVTEIFILAKVFSVSSPPIPSFIPSTVVSLLTIIELS